MSVQPPLTSRRDVDRSQESLLKALFVTAGVFLMVWAVGRAVLSNSGMHPTVPFVTGTLCLVAAAAVGRVRPCAAAALGCTAITVALVARAAITGGLSAPMMFWVCIPPFVAITLGGTRSARPMGVVAIAAIWGTYGAQMGGWIPVVDGVPLARLAVSHSLLSATLIVFAYHTRQRHRTSLDVQERANDSLQAEVKDHRETRASLDTTYGEMLQIARRAGMGEVATGVLHNVGNALNGVNTSVALAVSAVERADVSLTRVADLLDGEVDVEQQAKVAAYLRRLDSSMAARRSDLRDELGRIRQAAEHVAAIVQAQQQLATTGGVVEVVSATDLLSQSRLLLDASLKRHEIHLQADLPADLRITTDRHRVIQILTNLIGNARDALRDEHGARVISVSCQSVGDDVWIDVRDTGAGVPEALQEQVFSHGFTTKHDGHGFGLHASALAAKEIGGSLTLLPSSEGAHFRLLLPTTPTGESDSESSEMPSQKAALAG